MKQNKRIAILQIELGLAKLVDFELFTEAQKEVHRSNLAALRIRQIEDNPDLFPQGVTGNLRAIAALHN